MKIEDVVRSIQEGSRYLETVYDPRKTYTILIGPTGAGKSTLANVLVGNEIETKFNEDGIRVFDTKPESKSNIKISHGNKSETNLPNIQKEYIDCPGFGDTDPEKELQNAVCIQRVFGSKGQKVIIVAECSGGRDREFVQLLHQINNSTGGKFLEFAKQFGLCISKLCHLDYSTELIGDPSKMLGMMRKKVETSGDKKALELFNALEDRVIFFMTDDTHDSILKKLENLIPKLQFAKIPIHPVLTVEGEAATATMIGEVFGRIIESDRAAITDYSRGITSPLKLSRNNDYSSLLRNLMNHENKKKLFETGQAEVAASRGMRELVQALYQFKAQAEETLSLSAEGLDAVQAISDVYPRSNELLNDYKLRLSALIDPVTKLEGQIDRLSKDVQDMAMEWETLKGLTTTNSGLKTAIVVGGAVFVAGVGIGTAGSALAVAGKQLMAALVVGGVVVAGGTVVYKAAQACNAYEESHREVIPHTNKFKELYKKMPTAFAKLWLEAHDPEQSEYLPNFKVTLLAEANDSFGAEYNDILL